jgi:hypothetical protein
VESESVVEGRMNGGALVLDGRIDDCMMDGERMN